MKSLKLVALTAALTCATAGYAKEKSPPVPPPPAPDIQPDWSEVRKQVEVSLSARLIDPSSAEIQWPNGFQWGWWKPMLQKKVYGWVTCGLVNAKNRMGGYVGAQSFVVVYNEGVKFVDMDNGRGYGLIAAGCSKAAFPAPQLSLITVSPSTNSGVSVADELEKLVKLRDIGVLTPQEFEAQKARLLAR